MKKLLYNDVKEYFEKEGYTLLSTEYKNNNSKLNILCPNKHNIFMSFKSFKKGHRCIICAKKLKYEYNDVKEYFEKEGYTLLSTEYKNNKQLLDVKCPHNNLWKITFNKFKNNKKRCSCNTKPVNKHSYKYIKNFIKTEGYELLSNTYVNALTKLLLKCPVGHEYKVKFNDFQQGSRCPVCANIIPPTIEEIKKSFSDEGYILLSNTYINNNNKLNYKCSKGHKHYISWKMWKKGQRCPYCYGNNRKTTKYVKSFIEKEGYQLLSDTYINAHTKLLLKCPIGHEYEVKFNNFKTGQRCPVCNAENTSSKQERELQDYIESLGYNIIRNDRSQIINPLTGYNLELDIWIPNLKKAIEYNGTYWHNKLDMIKRDKIKADQCRQKGIDLLIVNEYNWIDNKEMEQDIIDNFLKIQ
jgi:uncharacterized protein YkuJ